MGVLIALLILTTFLALDADRTYRRMRELRDTIAELNAIEPELSANARNFLDDVLGGRVTID